MTPPRPSTTGGKQLAAVATAAIPVVMLSSMALAAPADAATVTTTLLPQGNHGTLDGQKVLAAVQARTLENRMSTSTMATSVPRAVTAMSPAAVKTISTSTLKHTVVDGDTISGIAANYGVSTAAVLERNNLSADSMIHPGLVLSISGSQSATTAPSGSSTSAGTATSKYTVRAGDTLSAIATKHNVGLTTLFSLNGLSANSLIYPGQAIKLSGSAAAASTQTSSATPAKSSSGSYVIKSGDTLSGIAAAHNVSVSALAAANNTTANGTIYAGKKLTIPALTAAASNITPITEAPAELTPEQQVPNTFLHYTYPDAVVDDANKNKAALLAAPAPTQAEMKEIIARTAASMGVDPALALAFAQQESGFNHQVVSPANAIGTMQVIPDAGDWASGLVGRTLNLLDPQDNVTAGIAIIRALLKDAPNEDSAIAGYYQGQYSVSVNGMFADTVNYVAGVKANRELFR